jgi:hypothetical protein
MKTLSNIIDLTPFVPSWHEHGSCMDRRHILWLQYLLMRTGVQRTLEIGVHTGASSSAFIAAKVPDAHFADITRTMEAVRVIGDRGTFHQRKGVEVLIDEQPFDLVLVDGAHDVDSVSEEIAALRINEPRIIVAHDVGSSAAGYAHCEGARLLWDHLVEDGWLVTVDHSDRPAEATKRGMLVATRDPDLHQIAKETWLMTT